MNIEKSYNFCRISERLTTSGVVPRDALNALRDQGYDLVVNLLPDTSEYAVYDERRAVESQGIEYIHIPVDFAQPTAEDFRTFSQAMDHAKGRKVHVHCAANFRVSAFYSLYQVRRGGWSVDKALDFIHGIWRPSEHPGWSEFIDATLTEGVDDE